jgi:hypothetical protein
MKITNMKNKISGTAKRTAFTLLSLFLSVSMIFAQAHPGTDTGLPTPIDGGILMALLAGGGLVAMLVKKKKDKNKE